MKIQINTDKNVEGSERQETYFSGELEKALSRFDDKITRIEVYFADENGDKSGINDKKCVIEARPTKMQPLVVTDYADSTEKAFHGALDKMKKILSTSFEKQKEH
ncbi:HPF/RaiA family ribosome-associated protein [Flavobacterium frigoris]|uniref:Ribosome-associated protein n=1 Tax=Flavobacterium frigoris (strain PS1) TaxID=1086011 RepID=H7FP39_FLAFP|nr:HPF/RaiA family ribosome-associated protein [Flavobacterium frigoris]EIA09721.1 putative ribosome-associated protein [Flavobacterium frigoris PS1]